MFYIPLHQPIEKSFLDNLLALGWYRMSQHVYTTQYVQLNDITSFEVLWARILLNDWCAPNRYLRLQKKCAGFDIKLQAATINNQIEDLYSRYRETIDFEASESVLHYLQDEHKENFFPTRMWQVYEGSQLVAASYFDEGANSAAGILSFFDPHYKKFSLGLMLYLHTVKWAAENKKHYFYPGYIAINHTKFDYKLLAGMDAVEIWDPIESKWHAYADSKHAKVIHK